MIKKWSFFPVIISALFIKTMYVYTFVIYVYVLKYLIFYVDKAYTYYHNVIVSLQLSCSLHYAFKMFLRVTTCRYNLFIFTR